MIEHSILSNISKHISLSEKDADIFLSYLIKKEVSKKELLIQQNKECSSIFFIISGTLRAYNLNTDGKESTIMFGIDDWWITDMFSFIKKEKSLVSIEALEQTMVLELKKNDLEILYTLIPQLEKFFRILMENAYIREQYRVLQILTLTSKERYNYFISKYPSLVKKLTQKQIATYLGITPEFLSMIKRRE